MTQSHEIRVGDCLDALRAMPDQSFHCCITSPPYFGLRDYGMAGQIGLEQTPAEFVARLVEVFREVRRVLRDDGTLWLNLGDSYARKGGLGPQGGAAFADRRRGNEAICKSIQAVPDGLKEKDLVGIPWRVAFALQDDGWYLRQDIIWHKPNPMPESVRDRCTKAHEYIFLLSKSPRYYFDSEAIKEPAVSEKPSGNKRHKYADAYAASDSEEHRTKAGLTALAGVEWTKRNLRSVWTVGSKPFKGAHFATFPPDLIRPCVLAAAPRGGMVLDPFGGAGTTALVAMQEGRRSVLLELNPEYAAIARHRLASAWLEGAAQLDLLHDQKESVA
ncbi:site-specific DNA-methyltransferase [Pseudomonas aeruginosa]|uniref:DNA-methyltransferase n=1 Tax=Pseudomonas aeruginosa TaxID=287 RepID=UPI002A76353C|nr:site-specific DNA-methyltransferase [Pseudomonas aeruginosa]MDY1583316.1 site-specific DNA-methyltransferase [Pseudomonas aeruginosa]HCE5819536.1 site-specific DNA-methyltransferase [Pseudomonas aeruginosa]